jgi:Tfp pilus assembly protein PilF
MDPQQRALQLYQSGQGAAAETLYKTITAADPDRHDAWHMLALIAGDADRPHDALPLAERAVALQPDSYAYLNTLGNMLRRLRQPRRAEPHFRRALELAPDHPVLLTNLAACLTDLDRPEQAVALLSQALSVDPRNPDAYLCLGTAFSRLGDLGNAEACFRNALTLAPGNPAAACGLADAKLRQRDFETALTHYRHAQALSPGLAEAELGEAHALLALGRYEAGWIKYEARWRAHGTAMPGMNAPLWDGKPLAERTLLIWSERGFGDIIQFIRCAPAVAAIDASVYLEVPPALATLIAESPAFRTIRVIAAGQKRPAFDCHAPLLSLPRLLGIGLDTIPPAPYLSADPVRVARWRAKLADERRLRIGLVWSGNTVPDIPGAALLRARAASLADLSPLAARRDIAFYSLQKGAAAVELAATPPGFAIADLAPELNDFADTAALIETLDHVVTIDTSVAHLCGALGRPASVALMADACWRWLIDRDDSPWYPSLRLFRQRAPGDWRDVFERIARALS